MANRKRLRCVIGMHRWTYVAWRFGTFWECQSCEKQRLVH